MSSKHSRGNIRVLAHYYIEPEYNFRALFKQRIAAEVFKIPQPGEIVIIEPEWTKMSQVPECGPGMYKVKEVRPNKEYPGDVYDYSPYDSWYRIERMRMIIVIPVFSVPSKSFKDYSFDVYTHVNEDTGIVKELAVITNVKTGELVEKEVPMHG